VRHAKKPQDLSTTADGLPLREVGYWSKDKLTYLAAYMDIFTTSMRQKWSTVYVDLFAGPGKSKVRDTGEIIKGSPLLALDLAYTFNKYIFVEADSESLNALEKRITAYREKVEIHLKGIDCNTATREITSLIPSKSLTLAFIDPVGCDIHFSTIRALADMGRADLFMTFPMGMDLRRNVNTYARRPGQDWTKYDHFFGSMGWRQTYLSALSSGGWNFAVGKTLEFYKNQLKKLGYRQVGASGEILIRGTPTEVPLYYLLFASKHPRGTDFWKKISAKSLSGQMNFKFDQ
jgi:three-Cys-motif partner protein